MLTLDATLKSLATIADDSARAKAMCKSLPTLNQQLRALADHPGKGVDAIEWRSYIERMSGGLEEFEMDCGDDPSTTKPLTEMIELYPGLFKLMAGEHL